ncbi:MAG: glutamate--cysteine ligase [Magnetococcales bacterium]|nr:glutamate--cysteine ligase [Magnetococcales bacterium]
MTTDHDATEAVVNRDDLVTWLEAGCTPRDAWRIGTEHEKFGFHRDTLQPLEYDGPRGIRAMLERMAEQFGWRLVYEKGLPIALERDGAGITLEPGGQIELSGAPLRTIHETQTEINTHLEQLAQVCRGLEMAFIGIGAQPRWPFEAIPWMPKGRYGVMQEYLPTRGDRALDMMARTCTVQANLDFESEADMVRKFRLSLAIQPLVTALFANSPFMEGKSTGDLSHRARIWHHTDPDRCGWLPFVFEEGFGFERYVDYALDVPMFFAYRDGRYIHAKGAPFRAFMEGRLPVLEGERPTLDDWVLHLSTLFPDVRLKRYLEMRGADVGNSSTLCALPALWKGLLHDDDALEAVWERVRDWQPEHRERMHREVPKRGLTTTTPGGETFQELAMTVLEAARGGLHRIGCQNDDGCDESIYLDPLFLTVESGKTPAHRLLDAFEKRWNGSVDPVFQEEEFESFIARCT